MQKQGKSIVGFDNYPKSIEQIAQLLPLKIKVRSILKLFSNHSLLASLFVQIARPTTPLLKVHYR